MCQQAGSTARIHACRCQPSDSRASRTHSSVDEFVDGCLARCLNVLELKPHPGAVIPPGDPRGGLNFALGGRQSKLNADLCSDLKRRNRAHTEAALAEV